MRTPPEKPPSRKQRTIGRRDSRASKERREEPSAARRRAVGAALRESEARYRELFEHNPAPILIYERGSLQLLAVNGAFERHYGYSQAEALAMRLPDLHPEDEKAPIAALAQRLHGHADVGEWRHRKRDGSLITIVARSDDITFAGRSGRIAVMMDITERKQADAALRVSQQRFQAVFEQAAAGVVIAEGSRGRFVNVNRRFCEIVGYSAEELMQLTSHDITHPDDIAKDAAQLDQIRAGTVRETSWEKRYRRKDGTIVWARVSVAPLDPAEAQPTLRIGVITDITARKQAEEALQASERQLSLISANISDVLFYLAVEPDGCFRFIWVNSAFLRVTGLTEGQVVGKRAEEVIPAPALPLVLRNYREAIRTRRAVGWEEVSEYPTGRKSGEVTITPVFDVGGSCTRLVGIVHDITERRQGEAALQQEQTLFNSLASAIPDHLYFKDRQSRFVRINDSMAQRFGLRDPGAAVGKTDFDFFTEEHARQAYDDEQRVMRTGEPLIDLEEKETWPDGRVSWVSTTKVPLRDATGIITGLVGISRDITERKRAEEARKESESRLRSIIESSKDGIIFFDGETRKIVLGNGAMAELLGCADEDLVGRSIPSLHPSEEWEDIEREFQKHVLGERSFSAGIPVLRNDGSVFYADISSSHIMLEGRSYFSAFFRDITERKRAEEALAAERSLLRTLMDSLPDRIYVKDVESRFLLNNIAHIHALGARSQEEVTGKTDYDFRPPDLADRYFADDQHVIQSGEPLVNREEPTVLPSGERGWLLVSKVPTRDPEGKISGLVGISREITARKRVEEALRESEERFRTLVEHAPDAVFVGTFQEAETFPRFAYVNAAAVELFGAASAAQLVGQPIMERIHPDYHAAVREDIHDLEEKESISATELIYLRVDGTPVPVELTVANITFQGRAGALLFVRDITERKKTEEKIREQALLLETASDAIMVRDLAHRILYWNKSAERLYGWRADEVLGREVPELHSLDPAALGSALEVVMQTGEWTGEVRHQTRTCQEITVLSRWSLVRDDGGRPKSVFVIDTDITERKKLEAQLYRAQRLESIGQLASGIAHDLNNILAPLVMVAPLLRMEIKNPETLRLVDILEANTKRGVDVVKQILTFSRGLKAGKGLVPLRPLLKEVINVLDETFPKSIALQSSIPEDLWMAEGDATQLHQVLMNLSVNARDAMPDGGTLTLAAENMVVDELYASMSPGAKPGPYVVWLVADTGTGIPPEDLDRIFDPFFTTKEPGKGTGLGLSTALGIVRNHGGFLKVESKPGKGTQFRVYLPAQMGAQLPAEPPADEVPPAGRGETILVVDDEEGVRVLTKKVLEQHGYHVLLASEGSEALVAYAQHATEIHAVLTDLMMPLMDGAALIRALKQTAPAVKILATTGVAESTHDAAALRLGAKEVLRKPFPPHVLLRRLRAVLDEPDPAP